MASKPQHDFHLVNPSPWPAFGALSLLITAVGGVFFMHEKPYGNIILPIGFVMVLFTMYGWWRDVVREAIKDKIHKPVVQHGLRLGMLLFIISEVMFFVAFFWAYFKGALAPAGILDDAGLWITKPGVFPPSGIETFDAFDIPFINTMILLLSGTTVTWAHYALLNKDYDGLLKGLKYTVILGIIFTALQAYEYHHAAFGFKDGVYSSSFYMATGFHGFHVIVGTLFLLVCYFRAKKGQFTPEHHLGFEFAAWYWHFVDVVWLFLFVWIYWWGGQ